MKIEKIVLTGHIQQNWVDAIVKAIHTKPDRMKVMIANSRGGSSNALKTSVEILWPWIHEGKVTMYASGILSELATLLYMSTPPHLRYVTLSNTAVFNLPGGSNQIQDNDKLKIIYENNSLADLYAERSRYTCQNFLDKKLARKVAKF